MIIKEKHNCFVVYYQTNVLLRIKLVHKVVSDSATIGKASKRSFMCKIYFHVSFSNIFKISEDFWLETSVRRHISSQNVISTFKSSSGNSLGTSLCIWFVSE